MLFTYTYVEHDIEKLQTYLDHLVLEVWCKASGNFSQSKLHPELLVLVKAVKANKRVKKNQLASRIRRIYKVFKEKLNTAERNQIENWYRNNNSLNKICLNDPAVTPVTYKEIRSINTTLAKELKEFYDLLWNSVLGLDDFKTNIAKLDEHYRAFFKTNSKPGKCAYCGYSKLKGIHHTKKEAYDHFLPKSIYPFISVNFKNLAPMCHECNSAYKNSKDPLVNPITKSRRRLFYSYADLEPNIDIQLQFNVSKIDNLTPDDINLSISSIQYNEETQSWREIFGIDERYKGLICESEDAEDWLGLVNDMIDNGETTDEAFASIIRGAKKRPFANGNFLKKSFLEGAKTANFIEALRRVKGK